MAVSKGIHLLTSTADLALQRQHMKIREQRSRTLTDISLQEVFGDAVVVNLSQMLEVQQKISSVSAQNASEAIAMNNLVGDALLEIGHLLDEILELAKEGTSVGLTQQERSTMQVAYEEYLGEINRIAESTEFNEMKPLMGQLSVAFALGPGQSFLQEFTGPAAGESYTDFVGLTNSGGENPLYNLTGATDEIARGNSLSLMAQTYVAQAEIDKIRGGVEGSRGALQASHEISKLAADVMEQSDPKIRDFDMARSLAQDAKLSILQNMQTALMSHFYMNFNIASDLLSDL